MRLKRRGSTPLALGDVAEHAIPHLHKTAENIRERFNYNMRSFCLNAEITKAQIDRVQERLVEKVKAMSEKAKDDVDKLAKEEDFKIEANVAGKLLEIDNRLSKLKHQPTRHAKLQHAQRISILFTELQNICDVLNAKHMEFKLHEKIKDFIECVPFLGKPRIQRRKCKKTINTADLECVLPDLAQVTSLSFTSLVGDLSSLSTSNNVSLQSIDSITDDRNLSNAPSTASSSFCLVNSYKQPQFNVSGYPNIFRRSIDEFSESTNDCLGSVSDSDLFRNKNDNDLEIDEGTNFKTLNVPMFEGELTGTYVHPSLKAYRGLEETSWGSGLTLSDESYAGNENECTTADLKYLYGGDLDSSSQAHQPHVSLSLKTEFQTSNHRGACVIPDIAIFPDKTIIVADHYHNNVQLYDKDFKLLSEKKCPYPMGVCIVDENTVAVSLRRSSAIALFKVINCDLHCVNEISLQCPAYIWNVTYKAGRLYVICDENNVHIIALDGTETGLIKTGVPVANGYIRYFDVSVDGNQLYLCEGQGQRLRCIDKYGNHIWSFDSSNVPVTFRGTNNHVVEDVCCTKGRLLATNWMQSKVFELSLDGKYITDVATGQLDNPRAMSVSGDTLVVTQFNPNMDNTRKRTIKVFKIAVV